MGVRKFFERLLYLCTYRRRRRESERLAFEDAQRGAARLLRQLFGN